MKNQLLLFLFCLFFLNVLAQNETYHIHPAYTDQVIAELQHTPTAFLVKQNLLSPTYKEAPTLQDEKILVQKRMDKNGSFILDSEIDIKIISGYFQVLGNYWVIDEDYGVFLKGGLINESIMKASDLSTLPKEIKQCNILIRNKKEDYYLVQSDFLAAIGSSSINKKDNDEIMLSKKSLEKITSVSYTIDQYQSMIERCKELTANLIVHGRMAKKGAMNKKQLKQWKTDLEEAKKLSKEIAVFKSMYDAKGSPLNTSLKKETTENYKDFSKVITEASKGLSL